MSDWGKVEQKQTKRYNKLIKTIYLVTEEEYEAEVVVNTKPKMSWDDEESDDNSNNVKEDWDDSDEEEEEQVKPVKKEETVAAPAPAKKNLTLKQKIAEKEAILKEQKAKKIALVCIYPVISFTCLTYHLSVCIGSKIHGR